MADTITRELKDDKPIFYTVMHGGAYLAGQLIPKLDFPLETGYLHATRYGDDVTGKGVEWKVDPTPSPKNRTVVVVDDILDEGHTLASIVDNLTFLGAKEVYVAVLVDKRHTRKVPGVHADYIGMKLPDLFLFGCGMDYKGYWRNTREIYAVKNP